jgi:hypothetical protein
MSQLQNITSGSRLNVFLEPTPYPVKVNEKLTKFKISFLKPGTNALQDHVDFNLTYDNNSRGFKQLINWSAGGSFAYERWGNDGTNAKLQIQSDGRVQNRDSNIWYFIYSNTTRICKLFP